LRLLLFSFFLLFVFASTQAQVVDTLSTLQLDSIYAAQHAADSTLLSGYGQLVEHKSPILQVAGKTVVNDVQQLAHNSSNGTVFLLLALLLVVLTYIKTAFNKDVEEMLQSFINRNMAMQLFRTQTNELSFSSALLHINFIVVMSMYVRFVFVHYFNVTSLESFSSILFLVFLFTFFYLSKVVVVKLLSTTFEVSEIGNEYIYHFSIVCKTLGLALLPALFVFYVAPSFVFNFVFVFTNAVIVVFALVFILRGLSTGYKLMYRSVYHFIIYVCVVEISSIFLVFKLLTKTVV
jgi:hypothetical protein